MTANAMREFGVRTRLSNSAAKERTMAMKRCSTSGRPRLTATSTDRRGTTADPASPSPRVAVTTNDIPQHRMRAEERAFHPHQPRTLQLARTSCHASGSSPTTIAAMFSRHPPANRATAGRAARAWSDKWRMEKSSEAHMLRLRPSGLVCSIRPSSADNSSSTRCGPSRGICGASSSKASGCPPARTTIGSRSAAVQPCFSRSARSMPSRSR